ncbi:hypothetical protein C0Q70_03626 [Pomacea canaliculata]|uniref:Uncharacterized protein n=1 Tax=Pomacea canaliculata TaxID=400727 RepID=A0A2T7PTC4_POMCA|nr:hypothetical protein C0Q70_03626 [Pomacea canaliculata]
MTRSDMMGMTPVGTRRDQERSVRGHGVHRTVNALRQEIQSSDRATQCSALSIHSTVVMGSVTECFLIAWLEVQDRVHADAPWKMSLAKYSGKKEAFIEGAKDSKLPRKVRKYYQKQLALIEAYEDLERLQHEDARDQTKLDDEAMTTLRLSQLSFFANFVLLVIKSIASVKSGSISVISSVVDSSFDLLSGIIIWYTSQAVQKTDYHLYPFGRRRLEPLAIFLLSVLMSMASLQLIWQSVERAVLFAKDLGNVPEFDSVTVAITCTVQSNSSLFLVCYMVKHHYGSTSSSLKVLMQDHRNDTISNTGALLCGYIGTVSTTATDRIDARPCPPCSSFALLNTFFSSFPPDMITSNFLYTIHFLTGRKAEPEILSQLTWLCLNHSPLILQLDTIKAYHCGTRLLVEVEIVVSEDMPLKATHDLRESLQSKLERLDEVERAIVHVCVNHNNNRQQRDKSDETP